MSNIADKVVVITGPAAVLAKARLAFSQGMARKFALGARRKDRIDALVRDINAKEQRSRFQD